MRNLKKLQRIAEVLHERNSTMTVASLRALIAVACEEGVSQVEIAERTGLERSTLSRILLDLGEYRRDGSIGLKLVKWEVDPNELRRKQYTLTPEGKRLVAEIEKAL